MIRQNLLVPILILLGGSEPSYAGNNENSGNSMVNRFAETRDLGCSEVKMETTMGTIIGLEASSAQPHVQNSHHYAFRGIPYAKPPIDERRFSDPIDFEGPWEGGVLNGTKFGKICPQYDPLSDTVLGSEDCLFLNVFTPYLRGTEEKNSNKELLPVLFFIHGGAFIRGSANAFGVERLLSRNLVVVTINYRIGALGFLSTKDSLLPGNYGILDQVSALRWVKQHISEFGGDPNLITVGGFSAGAASTNLHLYSPLTKDMVHQAIMLSGSSSCAWAVQDNPEEAARLLAVELSCPTAPSVALSSCVKAKDFEDILRAQAAIYRLEVVPAWFAPIIDGGLRPRPFLPMPLDEMVIRSVPVIMGKVPNEGLLFSANAALMHRDKAKPRELYDVMAPETFFDSPEMYSVTDSVAHKFYYSSHTTQSKDLLIEAFADAVTDLHFHICIDDMAEHLATLESPVYMYMMTHRDPASPVWSWPLYKGLKEIGYNSRLLKEGISHGDDLVYLFHPSFIRPIERERDQRVSDILTSLVANFIITGKPKTDLASLSDIPVWEPLEPGLPLQYYDLSPDPVMVKRHYHRQEARNFWKQVMPTILPSSKKQEIQTPNSDSCLSNGNCL